MIESIKEIQADILDKRYNPARNLCDFCKENTADGTYGDLYDRSFVGFACKNCYYKRFKRLGSFRIVND